MTLREMLGVNQDDIGIVDPRAEVYTIAPVPAPGPIHHPRRVGVGQAPPADSARARDPRKTHEIGRQSLPYAKVDSTSTRKYAALPNHEPSCEPFSEDPAP